MRTAASDMAESIDFAFYFVAGISLFFLVLITVLMLYFLYRYSNKRSPEAREIHGNITLEIVWTVIPTLLVIVMFLIGVEGFVDSLTAPDESLEVTAQGQMWFWHFTYDNGVSSQELRLPEGVPVKLNLKSNDVIHSFFIPAMRIKRDLIPGIRSMVWFTPQKKGEYDILCSEYCGNRHSYMTATLHVVSREEFQQWLTRKRNEEE